MSVADVLAGTRAWHVEEGDALLVLPTLPAGSIGHVVTDPPYGQTNEAYDSGIASDPAVWRECYRTCKRDAALVCFAGSPTYHRIASAVEAGGWIVRQMWGWVYRDGFITSAYPREGFDRLAPAMTPIVYATKGKVLLRLGREGEPWAVRFRKTDGHPEMSDRSRGNACRESAEGRWPRSLVADDAGEELRYFALSHNAMRDGRSGHPNQKPLALMRWVVDKLPPTGPILDPFAGSGTTLVAAQQGLFWELGSVGVERDPAYCAIARKRLREMHGPLFAEAP